MNAALTAFKWGIGENTGSDALALSWTDAASIARVEDEFDIATVSEELPDKVVLAEGEISDSRAVGSSSFVNRPIVGR